MYNPEIGTFFMPVGELGFALHEMHEISAISFGAILNAKYVLSTAELITSRSTPRSMTFIGS